jgi:Arc/MetJ family transcription regulator
MASWYRGPTPVLRRHLSLVYRLHMARTNIDLDEVAVRRVMRLFGLATKRDAVNFALRAVASEPLPVEDARALRGSGWDGDLDAMREDRAVR